MPTVKLISMTQDPMEVLKTAAGMCYQKKATDKVIKHIIECGHLSVLEHCYATFEITCSVAVLLQLTRHRHLSFTCQSTRGSRLTSYYATGVKDVDCNVAEQMSIYNEVCDDSDIPLEDAAYQIPKGAEYKLVVTGNFRAWFEYLPKRLCKRASKEHRLLAQMIYGMLSAKVPEVFNYVTLPCETCKESGCSFVKTKGKQE